MKKFLGSLLILLIFSILFLILYIYAKETQLYQFTVQLAIFSIGGFLVWKKDLKTTLGEIGFPGELKSTLKYAVIGFVILIFGMMMIGLVSHLLGVNDQNKVADKIKGMPWYILGMAIFMAPICEELLFRGYIAKRFGVVISAVVFGLVHVGYGSIVEIIGVTFVGLVLAYLFKKSGSIAPGIIIHMTYNFISIMAIRFFL